MEETTEQTENKKRVIKISRNVCINCSTIDLPVKDEANETNTERV